MALKPETRNLKPVPPPFATVYVVDDDPSFLTAVSRLLRAAGFEVKPFPSATEFLSSLSVPDQCSLHRVEQVVPSPTLP